MRSTYTEHPAFAQARSTSPTPSAQLEDADEKAGHSLVPDEMSVDEARLASGKCSGAGDSVNRFAQITSWTWITIFGQSVVLAVALTFFILVQFFHVPLEQNLAEWAKSSPSAFSFCVTVVATILSSISTFFFSKCLVLFLTSHSNRPTPLINFTTVTSLSRGTAVFSLHHLNWTFLSLLTLVLLNSLTASFTTILTPTPLIINVPIGGREFALDTDAYADAVGNPEVTRTLQPPTPAERTLNRQVLSVIGPVVLKVAYASASRHIGYPSVISYLGTSFNTTTGGVMPTLPMNEEALAAMPSFDSQAKLKTLKPRFSFHKAGFKPSKIFPFNYTTIQQGFSADIKCELISSKPAPNEPGVFARLEQNISLPDDSKLAFGRYFIQCPNGPATNRSSFLQREGGSVTVSATCPVTDSEGQELPGQQLLVLGGYGSMYKFMAQRACRFTTYFTLSEIQYGASVKVNRVISRTPVTAKTAAVSRLIFDGVLDAWTTYASEMRNMAGDDMASLYLSSSDIKVINDTLIDGLLETYFRGIIEARASIIRTPPFSASQDHQIATSLNDLSDAWTRPFTGTWSYETLGWHSARDSMASTIACIIPILLVSVISIVLSLYSWLSLRRSHHHTDEPFDPNNVVTLLTAGRDGSVVNSLGDGINAGKSTSGKRVMIQLQRNGAQWQLRPVV